MHVIQAYLQANKKWIEGCSVVAIAADLVLTFLAIPYAVSETSFPNPVLIIATPIFYLSRASPWILPFGIIGILSLAYYKKARGERLTLLGTGVVMLAALVFAWHWYVLGQ